MANSRVNRWLNIADDLKRRVISLFIRVRSIRLHHIAIMVHLLVRDLWCILVVVHLHLL